MYYVIERITRQHIKFLVINFKTMTETPWSTSIDTALQSGFTDTISIDAIEDRIAGLTCVAYGPLTSLPTIQTYPELFI